MMPLLQTATLVIDGVIKPINTSNSIIVAQSVIC